MSRTGNAWDTAAMESFFATLKKECVYRHSFQTRRQACQGVFEYVECFYNPIRLHSTLDYKSPVAFEQAGDQSKNEPTFVSPAFRFDVSYDAVMHGTIGVQLVR